MGILKPFLQIARNLRYGIRVRGSTAIVRMGGREIVIEGGAEDAWEVFGEQAYRWLSVDGKTVHDIGGSIGDSAMYFLQRGAKEVIIYEADEGRVEMAKRNLASNSMQAAIVVGRVERLGQVRAGAGDILKLDIEGGEYPLFENSSDGEISLFSEIIMELHKGTGNIMERLEKLGYACRITRNNDIFSPNAMILYASKKKEGETQAGGLA
ncbi:MAG: FkbM family methyltransferase [Candidatus Micrarchaeia archaeon]|jgi:hypothetical protein